MPRAYSVTIAAVSVSVAQDLFEIRPVANHPVEILGLEIGQTSSTTQENIGVSIIRGHATSGTGGTTPSPAGVPIDSGDEAAGFASEINNTTVASAGTPETIHTGVVNLLTGYMQWFYDQDTRPQAHAGHTTIVVRITAPAAARTIRATLWLLER